MRFALTTQAFCNQPLGPQLLRDVAAAGFEHIELFTARDHFDYEAPTGGATLRRWLDDARLDVVSVHAPVAERRQGVWTRLPSLAHSDPAKRMIALAAIDRLVAFRAEVGFDTLVVHVGVPASDRDAMADNSKEAARRSLEYVAETAERGGLRVALEVQANQVAHVEALVDLIENDLDGSHVGICFDFGHAHLLGDVVDGLEAASGHVIGTHLHDNRGRTDDHLWPFEGTIDWGTALMTLQKVGYEGACVLAPAAASRPVPDMLARATTARQRLTDVLYAM